MVWQAPAAVNRWPRRQLGRTSEQRPQSRLAGVVLAFPPGYGGEGGIRTLDAGNPHTRFPGVLLKPLGHLSPGGLEGLRWHREFYQPLLARYNELKTTAVGCRTRYQSVVKTAKAVL